MEMMIWNAVLSFIVGIMGFLLKSKFEDMARLTILLNRTREEIARDHITRDEVTKNIDKIIARFDAGFNRLEAKIDTMVEKGNRHG
jgi:hypothetical protein